MAKLVYHGSHPNMQIFQVGTADKVQRQRWEAHTDTTRNSTMAKEIDVLGPLFRLGLFQFQKSSLRPLVFKAVDLKYFLIYNPTIIVNSIQSGWFWSTNSAIHKFHINIFKNGLKILILDPLMIALLHCVRQKSNHINGKKGQTSLFLVQSVEDFPFNFIPLWETPTTNWFDGYCRDEPK